MRTLYPVSTACRTGTGSGTGKKGLQNIYEICMLAKGWKSLVALT